jgi:hypothetical protein
MAMLENRCMFTARPGCVCATDRSRGSLERAGTEQLTYFDEDSNEQNNKQTVCLKSCAAVKVKGGGLEKWTRSVHTNKFPLSLY